MRKLFLLLVMLLLLPFPVRADDIYDVGSGVRTDTNCNQSQYFPIGTLCQDTDDGKLYKGTGSAVAEVVSGASVIASSISDSDTTHCPDGNSVFDALAGKQATGSYAASNASTTVNSQTCTLGSSCTVTASLPSNPAACTTGMYVTDVAADGTLTCETPVKPIELNVSNADESISVGNNKAYFDVTSDMNGMSLISVYAACGTASTSGLPTFAITNQSQNWTVLSTSLTIDANELNSSDPVTPAVINASYKAVATNDRIRIDISNAGTGTASCIVTLRYQ